jgi:hypothetical protein
MGIFQQSGMQDFCRLGFASLKSTSSSFCCLKLIAESLDATVQRIWRRKKAFGGL